MTEFEIFELADLFKRMLLVFFCLSEIQIRPNVRKQKPLPVFQITLIIAVHKIELTNQVNALSTSSLYPVYVG